MSAQHTLTFIGNAEEFAPDQPHSDQPPYIFITVHPTSNLPLEVDPSERCFLPILLEDIAINHGRVYDIRGKIYCIHDMRVYNPDGYAFTGEFDALSEHGTLRFRYDRMLHPNPPRPQLNSRRPYPIPRA